MDEMCIKNTSYGFATVNTEFDTRWGISQRFEGSNVLDSSFKDTYLKSVFFLIVMKTENEWTS